MRHAARSWWLDEAEEQLLGATVPAPPLTGELHADVIVVGGGFSGLWTAWHALRIAPDARVAVLEAEVCGHGPSGRNGGFVEDLWLNLPALQERFGQAAALRLARAAEDSVAAIAAWCDAEGVDARFRRGGHLVVSAAPAQDGAGADAVRLAARVGAADKVVALSGEQVRARCASPVFREGTLLPVGATVQPARLALGLRAKVLERGAVVHEGTRVRRIVDRGGAGVEAHTATGGRVRAPHAVLAAGGALAAFPPLRGRLTVASSHIVLTEPVPDVLDDLGWTGGEAITDARALLHYFRTTDDGRVAFGWAGGRLALGARLGGRIDVDPAVAARAREHLVRIFPQLARRAITHAWGGPIDIAPARLPAIGTLAGGRVHHVAGYTGNGVGPSQLAGRILAALALEHPDPLASLAIVDPDPGRGVPPEPLRWAGGSAVLAAMRRKEEAEDDGRAPDPATAFVAGLPARLGITVGR